MACCCLYYAKPTLVSCRLLVDMVSSRPKMLLKATSGSMAPPKSGSALMSEALATTEGNEEAWSPDWHCKPGSVPIGELPLHILGKAWPTPHYGPGRAGIALHWRVGGLFLAAGTNLLSCHTPTSTLSMIYLLECLKELILLSHSCRISTEGNSRILESWRSSFGGVTKPERP